MSAAIKVVLLCGGIGKRLFPISTDKSLLTFYGQALIVRQIKTALASGLNRFVIVTNPHNDSALKSLVSQIKGTEAEFVIQHQAKGMADALSSALTLVQNEPFILLSADDIFEPSLFSFLLEEYNHNSGYDSYIAAYVVKNYFPGGYLVTDKNDKIKKIVEKPAKGQEPSNLVNIVCHLHTKPRKLLKYLETIKSKADDVYEKSLAAMIIDNYKMKAIPYDGVWQTIKYPWHILECMDYYGDKARKKIVRSAKISSSAIIEGKVVLEDNVKIMEGAVVRGPSYIGKNTVIGNNVLIRDSHIGRDCVVGFGSEVKHSYIGDGCWFHTNYVGDSVIDDLCSFGAGAVTANFRTDEQNVAVLINDKVVDTGHNKLGTFMGKDSRVGINASIMPGVRIGSNCFIGPHTYLNHDVDSNLIVVEERSYLTLPNRIKRTKKQK